MKLRTQDRSVLDFAGFYAPERIGRSRRITPEGFLVLEGTPIARTGEQVYGAHELHGLKANGQGHIVVQRLPEEVFRPETLQSAEGKDFVIEHPPEGVDVTNWKNHTVGHVQNVRRGVGIEDDLIVADILVKDPAAISWVNKNLPEISVGYEADYEQTEPGKATQHNIIINHVAAVKAGRAGPRVAVRDSNDGVKAMGMLNAVEIGKTLNLGICWTGKMKEDVSAAATAVTNWVTPFCIGHLLTAEPVPAVLKTGVIYAGELVRDEVKRGNSSQLPLSRAMDQLNYALNTNPPRVSAIEDAIELVQRLNNASKPTQNTGDGRTAVISRDRAMRQEIKDRNAANAAFWAGSDRVTHYQTSADVTPGINRGYLADQMRSGNAATRDLIRSINARNREVTDENTREWQTQIGLRR